MAEGGSMPEIHDSAESSSTAGPSGPLAEQRQPRGYLPVEEDSEGETPDHWETILIDKDLTSAGVDSYPGPEEPEVLVTIRPGNGCNWSVGSFEATYDELDCWAHPTGISLTELIEEGILFVRPIRRRISLEIWEDSQSDESEDARTTSPPLLHDLRGSDPTLYENSE